MIADASLDVKGGKMANRRFLAFLGSFLVFAIALDFTAFAQSSATGAGRTRGVAVTIQCNVAGADVVIDGTSSGKSPFTATLAAGDHSVAVTAPGYQPYNGKFSVTQATTIPVNLQPATMAVTINTNAPGASISIDGAQIKGNASNLTAGSHSVGVSAPGYVAQNTTINVSRPETFQINLQPATVAVTFSANVGGADIAVGGPGGKFSGKAPFTAQLLPGSYAVNASAGGYQPLSTQVNVTQASGQTFALTLQPSTATMNIVIPRNVMDPDTKDEGLLRSMVKVFVDGKLMNAKAEVMGNVAVAPGRHTIRIASGALSFQQDFDFAAGGVYSLEVMFGMQLRPGK